MDKTHFCDEIGSKLKELDRYFQSLRWHPPSTDAASIRQADRFSHVTEAQGRAADLRVRLDAVCAGAGPLSNADAAEIAEELAGIRSLLT
jgi:hypothetical protein